MIMLPAAGKRVGTRPLSCPVAFWLRRAYNRPCVLFALFPFWKSRSRMAPEGSVTRWLQQLQAGDAGAAQPLWER